MPVVQPGPSGEPRDEPSDFVRAGRNLRQGLGDSLLDLADQVAPGLRNLVKTPIRGLSATKPLRASVLVNNLDWRCKLVWPSTSSFRGGPLEILSGYSTGAFNPDPNGVGPVLPKNTPTINGFQVVWPYTPEVTINYQSNYEMVKTLQTNYATPAYQSSEISTITVSGTFTATTAFEANYLYAVLHFFKSATKGFNYENNNLTGSPPPVLNFSYMGNGAINNMPVVLTNFNLMYPKDVDYIQTNFKGQNLTLAESMVPTEILISISLAPSYSRDKLADADYSTTKFINGELLDKGFF